MANRTRKACLTAFGITLAVLSTPLLFGSYYFGLDLSLFDMGKLCELRARLAAGDSLLLSPVLGNGEPLLADPQSQLFYPLRWLLAPLPLELAVSLGAILHLALAAAAAAWLGRTFRLRPLGATCAGISFALSGTTLNLMVHTTYMVGAVTLPLAWAAGRRILQRRRGLHLPVLLFTALAIGLLGADPQGTAIALGLLGVEVLWAARCRRLDRRALLALGLPAAAGISLGLCAWVGAFAEMALTARGRGPLPLEQLRFWAFEPVLWIGAFAPGAVMERLRSDVNLWGLVTGSSEPSWNPTPYVGPLFFAAALVGCARRSLRPAAVVFAVALLVSMGDAIPLLAKLVRLLPVFGAFRFPAKYLPVATLAATVLAMVVLERHARRPRSRRLLLAALGSMLALQLAAIAGVLLSSATLDAQTPLTGAHGLPSLSQMLAHALVQGTAVLGLALLALALRPASARGVLPLLVVADLMLAAPTAIEVGPRIDDVVSPLAALPPASGRPAVICLPGMVERGLQFQGESSPWLQELNKRVLSLPDLNACDGVVHGRSYSMLQSAANAQLASAMSRGSVAAARAMGCTHLVGWHAPRGTQWQRVPLRGIDDVLPLEQGGVGVFAIDDPLAQSFLSRAPTLVSEGEAIHALQRATSAIEAASIVDDPLRRLAPGARLPTGLLVTGLNADWPERHRVTLQAGGSGGAVLAVLTSFQAGWSATQAGRPLPLVRVAGSHLGAVVEDVAAGPVELTYALPRRGLALACAAAGLLLLVSALFLERRSWREG